MRCACPRWRYAVAPLAGAWIEICGSAVKPISSKWSHPSRVRGLKCFDDNSANAYGASHPSRVRGLKSLLGPAIGAESLVAPLAGAWIEMTHDPETNAAGRGSHPSRVRGLKYSKGYYVQPCHKGRTPRGCVD